MNISLTDDLLFYELFANKNNIMFVKKFIRALYNNLNLTYNDDISVISKPILKKVNYSNRSLQTDIMIKIGDDEILNIEMYTSWKKREKLKSLIYITRIVGTSLSIGQNIKELKHFHQINIVSDKKKHKNDKLIERMEVSDNFKDMFANALDISAVYLDKLESDKYNINEVDELTKMLLFIKADSHEEREKIALGDEVLMQTNDNLKNFFEDEEFAKMMDYRNLARIYGKDEGLEEGMELGRTQGVEQKAKAAAVAFHQNGVSDDIICKSLDISLEQLQEYLKEA